MFKLLSKIFALVFIKQVDGLDNIPESCCIFAVNHQSILDPPSVFYILTKYHARRIKFFTAESLQKIMGSNLFLKKYGISVDRKNPSKKSIVKAVAFLRHGSMVVFPEGYISPDGRLQKAKTGVARLAIFSGRPVVPIGIMNSRNLAGRGKIWSKFKKQIRIKIGNPIYVNKRKITNKYLHSVSDNVMKQIAILTNKKYNP